LQLLEYTLACLDTKVRLSFAQPAWLQVVRTNR
jgi:hypothetical protein